MLDLEHAILAEKFQTLLATQHQAEQACESLAAQLTDPAAKEQLAQMQREKLRHIELVERLLEIVD